MSYDRIYRLEQPAGYKGRLCRVVKEQLGTTPDRWVTGPVKIEFSDGELMVVPRSAVILFNTKLGRQIQNRAKVVVPDGITMKGVKTREHRAKVAARRLAKTTGA